MKCENVQKDIVKFLDRELNENDLDKNHIDSCRNCSNFLNNSLVADKLLSNYDNVVPKLEFKDLELRINKKTYFIPTWFIAASILFAAILGSCVGVFNNYDMNERTFDNYSINNTTYISMVEQID